MKNKKLKIGVYFCGQFRGPSLNCYEYLKKTFEDHDFYTFIHTWDFYDGKPAFPENGFNLENVSDFVDIERIVFDDEYTNKIKNTIENIVYFETESFDVNKQIDKKFHLTSPQPGFSAFPNWYCAYKCNEYRKFYENSNGIRFDIILKFRPDIMINKINVEYFKNCINLVKENGKKIYSKYSTKLSDFENTNPFHVVWDYFTISSTNTIDILMNWTKDIMDGKDVKSSDYIIENNIIPNDNICYDGKFIDIPNVIIMREIFKYFNLNDYYEIIPNNILESINRIMYYSAGNLNQEEYNLFYNFYDLNKKIHEIVDFKSKEIYKPNGHQSIIYMNDTELKKLTDYFLERKTEYETLLAEI